MNNQKLYDNQNRAWVRVAKPAARKAYDAGQQVTLCPVKLHPFGAWNPSVTRAGGSDFSDFERFVRDFTWLNTSYEAGYYAAYYVLANAEVQP